MHSASLSFATWVAEAIAQKDCKRTVCALRTPDAVDDDRRFTPAAKSHERFVDLDCRRLPTQAYVGPMPVDQRQASAQASARWGWGLGLGRSGWQPPGRWEIRQPRLQYTAGAFAHENAARGTA